MLRAELMESLRMALGAIGAHKLRSCLTLLGVLIGVFSIIVTMTAMRVLKANIERELSGLGTHTFQVQKWPGIYFGGPEGFEKFWRRKRITMDQGTRLKERATLAENVGMQGWFWAGRRSRVTRRLAASRVV
jgi:putative ABC transport system permease protein